MPNYTSIRNHIPPQHPQSTNGGTHTTHYALASQGWHFKGSEPYLIFNIVSKLRKKLFINRTKFVTKRGVFYYLPHIK